jgi:hypothetical protein
MLARVLVALVGFVLVLGPSVAAADAQRLVGDFVRALASGDTARARSLVDTRYKSLPGEGAEALFRYESGYQPNLAFLVGQPVDAGSILVVGAIRSEWYVLDGTHGHHLTVPLRFEDARAPFLLPSSIAFGRSMAFVDFMNFVKRPDREGYAALTLRIRPSVARGRIVPPPPRVIAAPSPPVGEDPSRRPIVVTPAPSFEGGLLGGPQPRDPGAVILPAGEALTQPQLEALLPRVRAITLRLTVMQRGRFASWKVEDFGFANAVVVSHGTEIPLQ